MFSEWSDFLFMLGSTSGGLIGLLFVVVGFISDLGRSNVSRGIANYMTPTVLHLGAVLATSAVALMPRLPLLALAVVVGLIAAFGFIHAARASVAIRHNAGTPDPPHWTDFWTYGVLPAGLYLTMLFAAAGIAGDAAWASYMLASLLLALLLLSIRDAWDILTAIAPARTEIAKKAQSDGEDSRHAADRTGR